MSNYEKNRQQQNISPATVLNREPFADFRESCSDERVFHLEDAHVLPPEGKARFSNDIKVEREQEMSQVTDSFFVNRSRKKEMRPLSHWKVISGDEDWDDETLTTAPEEQATNGKNLCREDEKTHSTNRGRVCDPTAFYRNDTSGFLGELQKAEHQLFEKSNTVSKIDFPTPKRKAIPEDSSHEGAKNFDELLSDNSENTIAPVLQEKKRSRKQAEPEKVVVDVNDFVETFGVNGEPIYLKGNRKTHTPAAEESEFELLLNPPHLKRDIDRAKEMVEHVSDSLADAVLDDIADSLEANGSTAELVAEHEPSHRSETETLVETQEILVDQKIDIDTEVKPEVETDAATSTVTDVETVPSIPPLTEPIKEKTSAEKTVVEPVEEETFEETAAPTTAVDEQPEVDFIVIPEKNVSTEAVVKNNVADDIPVESIAAKPVEKPENIETDALDMKDVTTLNIAFAEGTSSQNATLDFPSILNRLEEIAGDQYDTLAEYIKDKVYDGNRLIAFCGLQRGVGCSTMTLLAAHGIVRHGLKTAIIDANFEFPNLAATLTGQSENRNCWIDVLYGQSDWQSLAMTSEKMPLLTFFPLAENALADWGNYEPERLQQETHRLITTLHEHFDLILLDCGCFENAFEEITWGELELFQPDGVIFVRNPKTAESTERDLLESLCRELKNAEIRSFGVAENFA